MLILVEMIEMILGFFIYLIFCKLDNYVNDLSFVFLGFLRFYWFFKIMYEVDRGYLYLKNFFEF